MANKLLHMDLTHYSVGAVPIDACRNHDHMVEKYRFFFARSYIFHSLSYTDRVKRYI
jgi:hypothetical protein